MYQKYQIDNQIQSTKEVVSKLTGVPMPETKTSATDEDALLESLNNIDYLLVQQKMPQKEKQDARIKLAEHIKLGSSDQRYSSEVPHINQTSESKSCIAPQPKGLRKKFDEIKSRRSDVLDPPTAKPKLMKKEVKYSERRAKTEEIAQDTAQTIIDSNADLVKEKDNSKNLGREKVTVNEKFNVKDILV